MQSQRALNVCRQQIAAKERERRILQLTIEEITSLQSDVNLYKGVGKMYVCSPVVKPRLANLFPRTARFMNVPRPQMEKDLRAEEKEITEDIKNLEKKVRFVYSASMLVLLITHPRASTLRSSSTTHRGNYVISYAHLIPL